MDPNALLKDSLFCFKLTVFCTMPTSISVRPDSLTLMDHVIAGTFKLVWKILELSSTLLLIPILYAGKNMSSLTRKIVVDCHQGFFQHFWEKDPGQNWAKVININIGRN